MSASGSEPTGPDEGDGVLRPEILFRDDLDGDVIAIDDHTWAIHGSIPVDRDVIIAEFDRREDAEEILGSLKPDRPHAPAPPPDQERTRH